MRNNFKLNSSQEVLRDFAKGKIVILIDDENRENEGDLILAADFVTPKLVNFMAKEARGLICLAMSEEQIKRLKLPMMVSEKKNKTPNKTAFTVSIEASKGVSTGISAKDRAHTIYVASRPDARPDDVRIPGHIFPIKSRKGGVLERPGHTEASVDLARLAGLNPAAVICEVMNEDGSMARVKDLVRFAKKHRLKIGTIEDLILFRQSALLNPAISRQTSLAQKRQSIEKLSKKSLKKSARKTNRQSNPQSNPSPLKVNPYENSKSV